MTPTAALCATVALFAPAIAQAQPPEATVDDAGFELPRAPSEIDPVLAVDVHFTAVFPVLRDPLCPDGAKCVFAGGGGVGIGVERRWPAGLTLGLGYDAWFLDSNNVYELGVMQMLSARVRYYFMQPSIVHPFLGAGVGALIFGDTLEIATLGVAAVGTLGLEWELTEAIALTVAIPVRFFTTSSFQTRRDRVDRAEDPGLNVAASVQFGLVIVETP